ncbi:hypothetical protein ABTX61_09155 [Amycolatopsis japonica]|uniref:hypothetical protein n=1 Tax=Amycolatopsis japonica TaxID=208439 RepID=UPI0033264144
MSFKRKLASSLSAGVLTVAATLGLVVAPAAVVPTAAADGGCIMHEWSSNVHVRACRTWYPDGKGSYYGSWEFKAHSTAPLPWEYLRSRLQMQGRFDGAVYDLRWAEMQGARFGKGYYTNVKFFQTRLCDVENDGTHTCDDWQ